MTDPLEPLPSPRRRPRLLGFLCGVLATLCVLSVGVVALHQGGTLVVGPYVPSAERELWLDNRAEVTDESEVEQLRRDLARADEDKAAGLVAAGKLRAEISESEQEREELQAAVETLSEAAQAEAEAVEQEQAEAELAQQQEVEAEAYGSQVQQVPVQPQQQQVVVPDVRGLAPDDAGDVLREAGLRLSNGSVGPYGVVSSQNPSAGARVRPGSGVLVSVTYS